MNKCPNCNLDCNFNREFKCKHCGEKFWINKESFEIHLKKTGEKAAKSNKLTDDEKGDTEVVSMVCNNCGYKAPKFEKWSGRTGLAVLFFFAGLFPMLIFIFSTSPWICPKCDHRESITKICNDGKKINIKAKTTSEFLTISIIVLVVSFILIISSVA